MSEADQQSTPSQRTDTSSAKRLHAFLSKLRTTNGSTLFEVLPTVLASSVTSHVRDVHWATIQALALVSKMISDVEQEVCNSPMTGEDAAFYLQFLPGVCSALSPVTAGQQWIEIRKKITDVDLTRIEHLDRVLRMYGTEREIETEEIEKAIAAVNAALDALENSSLARHVVDLISFHLLAVRISLEQYRFRGIVGVQEALAGYCGSVAMYSRTVEESADNKTKTKLMDVLNIGNSLVTMARGAAWAWPHLVALVDTLRPLLPS